MRESGSLHVDLASTSALVPRELPSIAALFVITFDIKAGYAAVPPQLSAYRVLRWDLANGSSPAGTPSAGRRPRTAVSLPSPQSQAGASS